MLANIYNILFKDMKRRKSITVQGIVVLGFLLFFAMVWSINLVLTTSVEHSRQLVRKPVAGAAPTFVERRESNPRASIGSGPLLTEPPTELCTWGDDIPWPQNQDAAPWLMIVVPTVARKVPHLQDTLRAIEQQLPLSPDLVKVVIFQNLHSPAEHGVNSVFYLEKLRYANDKRFDFVEELNDLPIPSGVEEGNANYPGAKVRAQTRDLVNSLRKSQEKHRPEYAMVMEDDFILCPRALHAIVYMIRRLGAMFGNSTGWNLIRFSFGFNGFVLPGEDVPTLAAYLEQHQKRRPPDHLLVEWFAGETKESQSHKRGRVHAAFRYNLLDHQGTHSTLRSQLMPAFLRCWQPLVQPINFEVETFKSYCTHANPNENIWPCEIQSRCPPMEFKV